MSPRRRRRAHRTVDIIDGALDRYVGLMEREYGHAPYGFRCRTLAHLAGIKPQQMSTWLGMYRERQGHQATRYVIACSRYGRAAEWAILAKPGDDPAVVQEARRSAAIWVAQDTAARMVKDLVHEIRPGLRDTDQDRLIAAAGQFMQRDVTNLVDFVGTMLTA